MSADDLIYTLFLSHLKVKVCVRLQEYHITIKCLGISPELVRTSAHFSTSDEFRSLISWLSAK